MKTIEAGLVVIDLKTFEIFDEFQRFIRPQFNSILTLFCKEFTLIRQEYVNSVQAYVVVGLELGAFIARYPNATWASWGD